MNAIISTAAGDNRIIFDNRPRRNLSYQTFNHVFESRSDFICFPSTLDELQRVVAQAALRGHKIRCSGGEHTFNTLSLTDDVTVRTDRMQQILNVNEKLQTVTVEAGVTIATLNNVLLEHGLSLPVQAATSRPTIVGAIATATHGSDLSRAANFSSLVRGATLVVANGEILVIGSQQQQLLHAIQCHLGCLGAIYSVELQCEPAFGIEQHTRQMQMDVDQFWSGLPSILSYYPLTQIDADWQTQVATLTLRRKIPLQQATSPGFSTLSSSEPSRYYIEAEVAVALEQLRSAFAFTAQFWGKTASVPATAPLLLRFSARDPSLLGMASGREHTAHISSFFGRDVQPNQAIRSLEQWTTAMVRQFSARCHFGKIHNLDASAMHRLYPATYQEFVDIREALDPLNTFLNPATARLFVPAVRLR